LDPNDLALLIVAASRGDLDAFRRLHGSAGPALLRVIHRICHDPRVAEDALQETFLKIWRGATGFDPGVASPMAWMSAVARNAAIDASRREQKPADRHDGEGEAVAPWVEPELLRGLTQCLDCLPAAQRDCVLLAYAAGYTREELAQHFGRPVGTIKIWLHRGLATLKACLDQG